MTRPQILRGARGGLGRGAGRDPAARRGGRGRRAAARRPRDPVDAARHGQGCGAKLWVVVFADRRVVRRGDGSGASDPLAPSSPVSSAWLACSLSDRVSDGGPASVSASAMVFERFFCVASKVSPIGARPMFLLGADGYDDLGRGVASTFTSGQLFKSSPL